MSRLGNRAVKLPSGVKINTTPDGTVTVEGPKGKISRRLPTTIKISTEGDKLTFKRQDDERQTRADHGLVRSVVNSMVIGAAQGFEKTLVTVGVGYRMNVQGTKLNLSLGFSHPVSFEIPKGITAKVADQTKLTLAGADKELLGAIADKIRAIKPPEPYKGKGIRYDGEQIILKEGKSAATAK